VVVVGGTVVVGSAVVGARLSVTASSSRSTSPSFVAAVRTGCNHRRCPIAKKHAT
jgi:hypothetical protein